MLTDRQNGANFNIKLAQFENFAGTVLFIVRVNLFQFIKPDFFSSDFFSLQSAYLFEEISTTPPLFLSHIRLQVGVTWISPQLVFPRLKAIDMCKKKDSSLL